MRKGFASRVALKSKLHPIESAMRILPLFTLVATVVGFAFSARSQTSTIQNQLDKILRNANFNGSALVSSNDKTLLAAGYGLANHEAGVKNARSTQHRIGSITKQFTAMAILILEEQGKLNTQSRVGAYLDDVPDTWRALTLHQLLTHTSGLEHSWQVRTFAQNGGKSKSLDETLNLFFDLPLKFEPGTQFHYSGVGYFLLAKIIETQAGQIYDAFLREHIFEPLEMKNTGCDRSDRILSDASKGYQVNPRGKRRIAPEFHMALLTGGGNLYSTVQDMQRWDKALREQKLIPQEAYQRMYQIEQRNYAYGWTVREQQDERWIFHGGGVPGHTAFFLRNPEKSLCVVLLSNHRSPKVKPLAFRLAKAVLNQTN